MQLLRASQQILAVEVAVGCHMESLLPLHLEWQASWHWRPTLYAFSSNSALHVAITDC